VKVIFLDFDGCLNSAAYLKSRPEDERVGVIGLDRAAVARLNRLVHATGASIVVSSTWRHGRSVAQLAKILCEVGFEGYVLGATPE
jgi:hypothetical protein